MARRTPPRRASAQTDILINAWQVKAPIRLRVDEGLQELAWRWSYALRNRRRWASRGKAARQQAEEVQKLVLGLGFDAAQLDTLAHAGLVEVSMPFEQESIGWEYRLFPWEYILAAATRERRRTLDQDFTVVRHLRRPDRRDPKQKATFLYVESAPTRLLADVFDFSSELVLAEKAAASTGLTFVKVVNPTLAKLKSVMKAQRPRIVHLAGFDTHQARTLLTPDSDGGIEPDDAGQLLDGYLLSDGRDGYEEIPSLLLAQAVTSDGTSPDLVSCNFFNSAPRTAALCVAMGARAAVGYQDTFDDRLGELFFATLYRAWALSNNSATSAFQYAWRQVRGQGRKITGTGVVLWNAESIVPAGRARAAARRIVSVADLTGEWKKHSPEPVTAATARTDLKVTVHHVGQLNYSILHNNRPLFESFTIAKTRDGIGGVEGITVNVELHVGRDSYPFRMQTSIPATQSSVDIGNMIRISLASTLSRAVRENVHTSLFIEVVFETVTLFRETRRVTLLPVDEWQDSEANRKWLPSFVLPRDPAVARVIDHAQRYLQALTDDPTAGFDGYQSVEEIDPKRKKYDCTGIDLQVRAIWCALLYETPLSYINPPPTFTDASQRLRAPSEVIDGHRGTCIDLTLLVASCLEYVEIYPSIILLTDHAFPCYWRAEEYFNEFSLARSRSIDPPRVRNAAGIAAPQQTDSWYFVKPHFREVLGEIVAGRLVPIESTCLCWRNSFADACEQGARNLSRRIRFDSMLDVRSAREDEDSPVTPLPILRVEG
jgi:hypothetical protein